LFSDALKDIVRLYKLTKFTNEAEDAELQIMHTVYVTLFMASGNLLYAFDSYQY